jgi:hypothetical protein
MELDKVASEIVLDSLKSALPDRWHDKVRELQAIIDSGIEPSLDAYLLETDFELSDVYSTKRCWSDLLEAANAPVKPSGPHESALRKAIGRMLHIDDEERLDFYHTFLESQDIPDLEAATNREVRMVRMLVASVCDKVLEKKGSLGQGLALLWLHPQVVAELRELFAIRRNQIDHIHIPLDSHPYAPLQIHGRYTRIEILAAFGVGDYAKTRPWREGVLWIEAEKVDVFAFTFDKSAGNFSPTTMYRDYAISRELIHWESQSSTSVNSPTGKRYRKHAFEGTSVMLFARQNSDERAFWFLGPATYVSHESERPMGITWKLETPLPGDLFSLFVAAVA